MRKYLFITYNRPEYSSVDQQTLEDFVFEECKHTIQKHLVQHREDSALVCVLNLPESTMLCMINVYGTYAEVFITAYYDIDMENIILDESKILTHTFLFSGLDYDDEIEFLHSRVDLPMELIETRPITFAMYTDQAKDYPFVEVVNKAVAFAFFDQFGVLDDDSSEQASSGY